jgi:hypothetical protein
MLCRRLRCLLVGRWAIAGLVCLALIGSAAAPSRVSLGHSEPATIGLRAPEAPLAALSTTSTVRLEKQAASVRLTLHKPERHARVSWATRTQATLQRSDVSHASPLLARRFLPSRHLIPRAPDESGDPLLPQLSLS